MVKGLFDTNILIDYLNGIDQAKIEFDKYSDSNLSISLITWMEVMVATTPETEAIIKNFLNSFNTVPMNAAISDMAVKLRKKHKIKLPDAIVWATAQVNGLILITRDIKDFFIENPGVRIPYHI